MLHDQVHALDILLLASRTRGRLVRRSLLDPAFVPVQKADEVVIPLDVRRKRLHDLELTIASGLLVRRIRECLSFDGDGMLPRITHGQVH